MMDNGTLNASKQQAFSSMIENLDSSNQTFLGIHQEVQGQASSLFSSGYQGEDGTAYHQLVNTWCDKLQSVRDLLTEISGRVNDTSQGWKGNQNYVLSGLQDAGRQMESMTAPEEAHAYNLMRPTI
ncbi:WXG100 family type VII secretion target [Streptomyces sp. NPDC090080]|uniref:WXG100 family type VII secretion target n=1 Tax=Streptomyces sp. NPDC090080 TaxID=3365939 RepID=UPI00382650EC